MVTSLKSISVQYCFQKLLSVPYLKFLNIKSFLIQGTKYFILDTSCCLNVTQTQSVSVPHYNFKLLLQGFHDVICLTHASLIKRYVCEHVTHIVSLFSTIYSLIIVSSYFQVMF